MARKTSIGDLRIVLVCGQGALGQEEGNKEACGHKRGADDKNLVQGVAKGASCSHLVAGLAAAEHARELEQVAGPCLWLHPG